MIRLTGLKHDGVEFLNKKEQKKSGNGAGCQTIMVQEVEEETEGRRKRNDMEKKKE